MGAKHKSKKPTVIQNFMPYQNAFQNKSEIILFRQRQTELILEKLNYTKCESDFFMEKRILN